MKIFALQSLVGGFLDEDLVLGSVLGSGVEYPPKIN